MPHADEQHLSVLLIQSAERRAQRRRRSASLLPCHIRGRILSEGSVATGIRRIEAITGREASKRVRQAAANVRQMAAIMSVPVEEVVQKAEQNQQALQKAAKDIADFRAKLAMTKFDELKKKSVKVDDADVLAIQVPDATPDTLREKDIECQEMKAIGVYSNERVQKENAYSRNIIENAYAAEVKNFMAVIAGGEQQCYSFEEDKEVLQMIDRIEK